MLAIVSSVGVRGATYGLLNSLRLISGCGKRAPIDFAVGRERQRGQQDEVVPGPCTPGSFERSRAFSSSTRSRSSARVGHDVGDEALVPRRILAREDDRLPYRGMQADRRLDLAQLDSESADLDLVVDASEVLEIAVGQTTRQIARPVQPLAARLRRKGSE